MPLPPINPPLINSANPWATTQEDLQSLYDCPHTGAVTTRTSLIDGFEHNGSIHQYTFFDSDTHLTPPTSTKPDTSEPTPTTYNASLNTLGYSPIPLSTYLKYITQTATSSKTTTPTKPFIISVTGSAEAVAQCYSLITAAQRSIPNPLCMEINLSCPNIPDKPPPAYSKAAMVEYLDALADQQQSSDGEEGSRRVAIGVKTPPYTYHDQFRALVEALLETKCEVDFVTATNTLGSCLVLADSNGSGDDGSSWSSPAINSASGLGVGGMAGAPLHPLALGNVKTITGMLDGEEKLRGVDVIGVGGVSDRAGFDRMRTVGAKVVGVGTALGREGTSVFGKILASGGA